jgi:hypothetical protein
MCNCLQQVLKLYNNIPVGVALSGIEGRTEIIPSIQTTLDASILLVNHQGNRVTERIYKSSKSTRYE